ncbi:DUF6683 family protein [Deinococcus planocerae]|uniref:DUF6683 family protein n=1 Tax=Deinococcus planocerae TaxID=1737569 RepID=UPI000C7F611D|nr:DUF6683 family protein [Deinococcus planocerae]
MRTVHRVITAGVLTLSLGFLSPVGAQIDPQSLSNTALSIYQTMHWNNVLSAKAQQDQALPGRPAPTPRGPTTFRPSPEVRKRNLAGFVAKTRAADPQGAAELERLFASTDVIGEIGKALAPSGLRTDDVADATAVYLVAAWYGVRGRDDDPSRAQLTAVRDQMARALANTPRFTAATDAQRQELAEAMLIQAALVSASVGAAKGQPAALGQVKAAVARGARATLNLDLTTVQLTDRGLQRGP